MARMRRFAASACTERPAQHECVGRAIVVESARGAHRAGPCTPAAATRRWPPRTLYPTPFRTSSSSDSAMSPSNTLSSTPPHLQQQRLGDGRLEHSILHPSAPPAAATRRWPPRTPTPPSRRVCGLRWRRPGSVRLPVAAPRPSPPPLRSGRCGRCCGRATCSGSRRLQPEVSASVPRRPAAGTVSPAAPAPDCQCSC
jgi:hypothetical protein